MQTRTRIDDRTRSLRDLLNHQRNLALTHIREYRAAQEADVSSPPGDELDAARALAEVETHAGLIERAEDRLRAIDFAFNLLEQHRYGICAPMRRGNPDGTAKGGAFCHLLRGLPAKAES
jgi:RNA polymerase-binding transcription factor DksA